MQACTVQIWSQPWLNSQKMTDFSCSKKEEPSDVEEESNDIIENQSMLEQLFQQAKGNVDMIMNQIPAIPAVLPEIPKLKKVNIIFCIYIA